MIHYPLMEEFGTLQGEGQHAGKPAYFIRLGGCDVGCVWCDVKDSWDASQWPKVSVETLCNKAAEFKGEIVVITGGEPAMYDLTPLTQALKQIGKKVHIETSGAHPIKGDFDWITFSPKKFKAPLAESALKADELKIVVFNKSDFAWAEKHAQMVHKKCKLFLQAEWDKRNVVTPLITQYLYENPQWQLSVQTHKYLGLP